MKAWNLTNARFATLPSQLTATWGTTCVPILGSGLSSAKSAILHSSDLQRWRPIWRGTTMLAPPLRRLKMPKSY